MEDQVQVEVKSAADLEAQTRLVLQSDLPREEKYLQAQALMESYAVTLKSEIDDSSEATEVTELAEMVDGVFAETRQELSAVAKSLAEITEQNAKTAEMMGLFLAKMEQGTPVQKSEVTPEAQAAPEATPAPVQRSSAVPPLTVGIQMPTVPDAARLQRAMSTNNKPSSLRAAVRRSVGLSQ